jgi:hypothetical protein
MKSAPSLTQTNNHTEKFNVVALYDNLQAGKRAHEACNCLLRPAVDEAIKYDMWNFDVLQISEINQQATRSAAEADLVIVAASEEKPFEPHVREWLNRWVEIKSPKKNGALLALCDSHSNLQAYLQEIARRADFQFFTHAA